MSPRLEKFLALVTGLFLVVWGLSGLLTSELLVYSSRHAYPPSGRDLPVNFGYLAHYAGFLLVLAGCLVVLYEYRPRSVQRILRSGIGVALVLSAALTLALMGLGRLGS